MWFRKKKNNKEESPEWEVKSERLEDGRVTKYQIFEGKNQLTFFNVLQKWALSEAFRNFYNNILADSVYQGFFWETPPQTRSTINQPFEFVLVKSSQLPQIKADQRPFSEHFNTRDFVISFPNLGGDAHLIVPTPQAADNAYPHFAAFIRNAPEEQKHQLWIMVSNQYLRLLNDAPRWLSTAGLGVYWLHLRIDTRPKYYSFLPYKTVNG